MRPIWKIFCLIIGLFFGSGIATGASAIGGWATVIKLNSKNWCTPKAIESGPGVSRWPRIAVDTRGNATVIWRGEKEGQFELMASRRTAQQQSREVGWGIPISLGPYTKLSDKFPPMLVDDNRYDTHSIGAGGEDTFVVYEYHNGEGFNVWSRRYHPLKEIPVKENLAGIEWGSATALGPSFLATSSTSRRFPRPRIAVNANGGAIAVGIQTRIQQYTGDITKNVVWARRFRSETGWTPPEILWEMSGKEILPPVVALDDFGNAMVVAFWGEQGDEALMGNKWYSSSSGWTEGTAQDVGRWGQIFSPQISLDQKSGKGFIVMGTRRPNDPYDNSNLNDLNANIIKAISIDLTTKSFTRAMEVLSQFQAPLPRPKIAMGPFMGMAVWLQDKDTKDAIWYRRYLQGSGWGPAGQLPITGSPTDVTAPSIAIDPSSGNAVVAWTQGSSSHYELWVNIFSALTDSWGTPEPIPTMGSVYDPEIGIDPITGNAFIVWGQQDGLDSGIWSVTYAAYDTCTKEGEAKLPHWFF